MQKIQDVPRQRLAFDDSSTDYNRTNKITLNFNTNLTYTCCNSGGVEFHRIHKNELKHEKPNLTYWKVLGGRENHMHMNKLPTRKAKHTYTGKRRPELTMWKWLGGKTDAKREARREYKRSRRRVLRDIKRKIYRGRYRDIQR